MYLIVIQVPFQEVAPGVARVGAEWARELQLLRDSLGGRYGRIVVAAPTLPADFEWVELQPVELKATEERISFVRLCDANLRTRHFWPRAASVLRRCLALAKEADVVHAGMSDLYRPIAQFGFFAGLKARVPTVFVEDTDTVTQLLQLNGGARRWGTRLYCHLYGRIMRFAVTRADLSLLKGRLLHARYARFASNARDFHDTSYSGGWVIPESQLDAKISELARSSTLRCLSLGRLVARKGVDETLRVVAELNAMGVPVELDVIGDGPARGALETQVRRSGLESVVRFLGARPYGRQLVEHLRRYHLMLFTPIAEDTPRSLFDCLAAATPIAGYAIDYLRSLLTSEQCGVAAPVRAADVLACEIRDLWINRERLCSLVRRAAAAGRRNSAEVWYARRAGWTFDISHKRRSSMQVKRRA